VDSCTGAQILLLSYISRLDGLIKDTSKLQSYIDNALIPMVKALKDEPGLGGWDVINEAEGEMIPGQTGSSTCDDTSGLSNSGMGWEGELYSAHEIQRYRLRICALFNHRL